MTNIKRISLSYQRSLIMIYHKELNYIHWDVNQGLLFMHQLFLLFRSLIRYLSFGVVTFWIRHLPRETLQDK
jgi:hypothetical protein